MTETHYRAQLIVDTPMGILQAMTVEDWGVTRCAKQFFLSEVWLRTWLNSLPETITLVLAKVVNQDPRDRSTVALAIFGVSFRRSLWHRQMQWNLFRTGDPVLDQIWIEDNHVLIKPEHSPAEEKLWQTIKEQAPNIEIIMQVTHKVPAFDKGFEVEITNTESAPYFCFVDRKPMLKKGIEKKLRSLSSLPFTVSLVEIEHALAFDALMASSVWHVDKWRNTDTPSGFSNAHFVNFHRELWSNADPASPVKPRLYQLFVDKYAVLTLYGLQHGGWFGFYCLCQAPQPDNKWRFGLYTHWLLQKKLAEEGFVEYDFMAGDDSYKLLLSNHARAAFQLRAHPKTLRHRIENQLKHLKARYVAYKTNRGNNEKL